jgi:hypothetical protein
MIEVGRFKCGSHLTHRELDRLARGVPLYGKDGWHHLAQLELDLSSVEYAEFSACARIITLVEGAARHAIKVEVVPPGKDLLPGEYALLFNGDRKRSVEELVPLRLHVAAAIRRRRRFGDFLANTQFLQAIRPPHIEGDTRPTVGPDPSGWHDETAVLLAEAEALALREGRPIRGRVPTVQTPRLLPFRWLGHSEASETWKGAVGDFLYGDGLLMTRTDADRVASTVVEELVSNVRQHAGIGEIGADDPPHSLLGGLVVAQAKLIAGTQFGHPREYPHEARVREWLLRSEQPMARLVVADSGVGIPATLGAALAATEHPGRLKARRPGELIMLSFSVSGSRHQGEARGAGLAVVRNFVRTYAGLVSVRAASASAGYWYPARSPEEFADEDLAYTPGTLVDVMLSETVRHRFLTVSTRSSAAGGGQAAELLLAQTHVDQVEGLHALALATMDSAKAPNPIVVLCISGWPSDQPLRTELAREARRIATTLEGRGGLAVILIEASVADVGGAFDTVRELGEAPEDRWSAWRVQNWSPPFLIVAADGSPFWAGGTEELRSFFDRTLSAEAPTSVESEVNRHGGDRGADYLRSNRDWISVAEDGVASIRVSLEEISDALAERVESGLARRVAG